MLAWIGIAVMGLGSRVRFLCQDETRIGLKTIHKAKRLQVPSNIILMFQPPYTPELNPIERVWQHLKRGLRWKLPRNLEELRELMKNRLEEMTKEVIASIVGWDYILEALSVAGI